MIIIKRACARYRYSATGMTVCVCVCVCNNPELKREKKHLNMTPVQTVSNR